MIGLRILGWVFSGVFAFCISLLGYTFSRVYLQYLSSGAGGFPFSIPPSVYTVGAPLAFTLLGVFFGFMLGSALYQRIVGIGKSLRRIPAEDKIACFIGTLIALVPSYLIGSIVPRFVPDLPATIAIILLESVLWIWLVNVITLSMKDEMRFFFPGMGARATQTPPADVGATHKLLDTNIIIDGRIYDICRSGFIEGSLILPGFVLEELQHIADSADALRRNRGRRGLDILQQMQTDLDNALTIQDRYKAHFAPGDGVDIKLVKCAKATGADIITNDYNLNKVAKLHGVRVLNINELANAVKPVVLPGEELQVMIVKEGKEYNQGVGYLDDGTMIVVENGKKMMGDTVAVSVSSVLQTVAGKMIFAELKYENGQEESDEHNGYYTGRGNRRKTY